MKKILIVVLATTLGGCVVAPEPYYPGSAVYSTANEYYWEPSVNLWYFDRGGRRYWQPRGWAHPVYGVHGGYHR